MALSKKPVNGMKDILPAEMEIRDYVTSVIKDTYRSFGFTPIETPCMENIANLTSKQGGENEKLIFKVMKRGEKLNLETAKEESDVVDFGMRYDLTVPLSRYYSNNANNLPSPFKALQMGSVWRADRPQRGRYRQFTQCDIDILGEPSNLAEIELITATTTTIGRLGFENFEIRINERRILKAMAAYSGFAEADYDSVFMPEPEYLTGSRRLCAEDISFAEDIIQNDNLLEFYMEVSFNADQVFGTDVCTSENDDWLNIYANYDLEARRVCDTLELYLQRGNGDEEAFKYRLSAEEQALLLPKMNTYCQEHWGQSLEECSADYLAEQSQELPEMQM